jgi:hypothetical protein
MESGMRILAALLSLLLVLSAAASSERARPVLGPVAKIRAEPVDLQPGDPARKRVGALTYLGGVRLRSSDPAFGGFSAMLLAGGRFTLISDAGNVVRFRLGSDWQVRDAGFGDLPGGPGTGRVKWMRDAESLAVDPAGGSLWVGFENSNEIWRYDSGLRHVQARVRPRAMANWPDGGGAESMTRLRDGRFVLIGEWARPKGARARRVGLIFARDPVLARRAPLPFAYVPPAGYDPTDIAELPDGRLLVLTRSFAVPALFTAKLTLIDLRGIKADAVVRGIELATFERPLLHDNFEALAVAQEGGATIVWIASDDNGEFWEQSLLLKFRIDLPR